MDPFRHTVEVRWSDVDANQHVRHTAYSDFCTHARVQFLTSHGFGWERFQELAFGPVMFKEWTEYLSELKMNERVTVELRMAALNADGSRFAIRHELFKEDGRLAGRNEIQGAWMDLRSRKLLPPPAELADIFRQMARTDDFVEIRPRGG